jgi:hypothetical protein
MPSLVTGPNEEWGNISLCGDTFKFVIGRILGTAIEEYADADGENYVDDLGFIIDKYANYANFLSNLAMKQQWISNGKITKYNLWKVLTTVISKRIITVYWLSYLVMTATFATQWKERGEEGTEGKRERES